MKLERRDSTIPNLLAPIGDPPKAGKTSLDPFEAVEVVKAAMYNVSDRVVGRQQLVEQTLLALLSREHQLIQARTGTAKTLYAGTVFGQFMAETFFLQFTRTTPEEAIFGAIDLKRFKQGVLWHDTKGTIVTADLAFLDELMDANEYIMRALLGILNERVFSFGKQVEDARLHTAIAATNLIRRTELTEPVIDRFLFQAQISPDMTSLQELLMDRIYAKHGGRLVSPKTPIPMDIPRQLARIVKGENKDRLITCSFSLLFLKNQIIRRYRELTTQERQKKDPKTEMLFISPRTIAKCRDVLNASALLHHRNKVEPGDLLALRFALVAISGGDIRGNKLPPQEALFLQAIDETLAAYSNSDLSLVEELMRLNEFIEAFKHGEDLEAIKQLKSSLARKILQLLGVLSWQDVTEQTFIQTLEALKIDKPPIDEIRNDLIRKVKANNRE